MKNLKTRDLAIIAIFLGLDIVISSQFITIAPNLRIYFSFIIKMLFACMYPIKFAFIYGFAADTVGYLAHPSGAYFPGYLLTSIASSVIYSLFLYKEVNLKTVIISKTLVNLLVNIGLGSIWTLMTYSRGRTYLQILIPSLIKNMTLLPLEILLFFVVYRLLKKQIQKYRYVEKRSV